MSSTDGPASTQALRASILRRWHGALRDSSEFGVFERDLSSGQERWDERLRDLLGWPLDGPDPDPRAQAAMVWPEDREIYREAWQRSLHGGGDAAVIVRMAAPGTAPRWLNLRWVVVSGESGQGRRAFGRVWALPSPPPDAAQGGVERVHGLLAAELAQVGLLQEHLVTRELRANDAARRIFGLPASGRLTLADFGSRMDEATRSHQAAISAQLVAGSVAPEESAIRIQHPTLGERQLLVRRRVRLRPEDGQREMLAALIDVTETLQAEQRAAAAEIERDQASALAAERMALLAAVSHEVRSPLNAILAAAEQLAALGVGAEPRARVWLSVLKDAGSHLFGLAEDLLQGASFEQRATAEAPRALALELKVRRAMLWSRRAADAAGVSMHMDDSVRGLHAHVSAKALRQVLLNLTGNAIKYNRAGGWVRYSARALADQRVELIVEDSGRGMSAEQQRRLFRPFDRLGREHDSAAEGFGLGLYLVHRLVMAMDGEIEVHSEEGRGTRVLLRLPAAAGGAIERATPSGFSSLDDAPLTDWPGLQHASGRAWRVLAVDDDPLTPTLLRAQFAALGGVDFSCAPDVAGALKLLRERGRPDLVMLDLHLGLHSGEEVLTLLREAGYAGPAVAFTGEADPLVHQHLMGAGFADVWTKPVPTAALRQGLERIAGHTAG